MKQQPTEASGRRWPLLAVAVASVILAYVLIVSGPKTAPQEKLRPPKTVTTEDIRSSNHQVSVRAHGTVIPVSQVQVEPEVTGLIIRHHPDLIPGGYISAGEELFAIDPTMIELSLLESAAAVTRAEATLEEAQRKRAEAQKLSSERVIAKSDLAAIEADVKIQTAELARLNAGLARTEAQQERHTIRAPFNAIVLEESVEIGQRVNPGFPAATLVGTDAFWVSAVVPVDKLQWIQFPTEQDKGAKAEIYFDAGDTDLKNRSGRVVQLLGDMEREGRMARVLIRVDTPLSRRQENGHTPLLLGSYVRVEIDAGMLENVLAIPRKALREGNTLWVLTTEEKLDIRETNVRWIADETIYVENILRAEESLITSPLRVALPGMRVKAFRSIAETESGTTEGSTP